VENSESQRESLLKPSWTQQPRRRMTPWNRLKTAAIVLPPNEQASNSHLTNEEVMRSRNEKISHAFRLNGEGSERTDG
jgi:hypothetical protein